MLNNKPLKEYGNHVDNKKRSKNCFKPKTGIGAFLLSFDGLVIPLRKAKFINRKH